MYLSLHIFIRTIFSIQIHTIPALASIPGRHDGHVTFQTFDFLKKRIEKI